MSSIGADPVVLDDYLTAAVARFPDRPAMDFLGRRWRYRELGRLVDRATAGLQALGVGPGSRVGLCLPNTPYYVICYYAVLRIGGTVVNFNPLYVEREVRQQIADSATTIMVVLDLEVVYRRVANVAAEAGLQRIIVCPMAGVLPLGKAALFTVLKRGQRAAIPADGRHLRFADLLRREAPPTPALRDPTATAVLQYTGGTTGVPKAAMLSQANLVANARQLLAFWSSTRPEQGEPAQQRTLAALPFFHVFAMTTVLNFGVAMAAEIVMLPRFDAKAVLGIIARRRITLMNAVPTIYAALIKEAERGKTDMSSLRFSISGGAPLPQEIAARFTSLSGCVVVEGYGLTEASPVVCCNPLDGTGKAGSAGRALADTVIEIRDPAMPGGLLPPGDLGEICIRGPQVMTGYLHCAADTATAFIDGALRTGDIGTLDADGFLFLMDRIKDVILCGGYNVYPRVLEDALYEHPAVLEATVIGVPDAYRGQAPKAFVVLRPGATATPATLKEHLAGCVSKIELPREIVLRTSLPKTVIGKLSKKELVAEEAGRAEAARSV